MFLDDKRIFPHPACSKKKKKWRDQRSGEQRRQEKMNGEVRRSEQRWEERRAEEMRGEVRKSEQSSKGCPVTWRFSCIQSLTCVSLALQFNSGSPNLQYRCIYTTNNWTASNADNTFRGHLLYFKSQKHTRKLYNVPVHVHYQTFRWG